MTRIGTLWALLLACCVLCISCSHAHSGDHHKGGYSGSSSPGAARYAKYKRRSFNAMYDAYKIPVKLNYTLARLIEGDTPPGTIVGNYYQLYGDIWEADVVNFQLSKWLGRYTASAVALAESKDYPTTNHSSLTPFTMQFDVVAEFGADHHNHANDYKDSINFNGIQDITLSDIPTSSANWTAYYLDQDLAIYGGLGFWEGAVGHFTYADIGHMYMTTAIWAGSSVPAIGGFGGGTFYVYRPKGGLGMS